MDPWGWDVEEVISQVFHSNEAWSVTSFTKNPPSHLADVFRQEEISGTTLLSDFTQQVLRDEPFNVAAFGQRGAVLRAIEVLQNNSPSYIAHHSRRNQTRDRIFTPTKTDASSSTVLRHSGSPQRQAIQGWNGKVESPLAPEIESPLQPAAQLGSIEQTPVAETSRRLFEATSPEHVPPPPNTHPKRQAETGEDGRKRRRIQVTNIQQPAVNSISTVSAVEETQHSHLGAKAVDLDEMFWGDAKVGDTLRIESDDDDNFDLSHQLIPRGKQKFIDRRMRYFLRRRFSDLDPDGLRAAAPAYPKRITKPDSRQAMTLIDRRQGRVTFKKTDSLLLYHEHLPDDVDPSNTQWDFLLERAPGVDIEDELETSSLSSYSSSLRAEIEAEKKEAEAAANRIMSPSQVDAAIDAAIAVFEDEWRMTDLPKLEARAHSIWKWNSRRARQHGQLTPSAARVLLPQLEARLAKYRREIKLEVWNSVKQVQKQCRILDATVHDIKSVGWKLNLWRQPKQPAKSTRPRPVPAPARLPVASDSDDGDDVESLHSEPLFVSDNEDEDAFVSIDEVGDGPSLKAEPAPRPRALSSSSVDSVIGRLTPPPPPPQTAIEPERQKSEPAIEIPQYHSPGSPMVVELSDDEEQTESAKPLPSPEPRPEHHDDNDFGDGEEALEAVTDEQIDSWSWQDLLATHASLKVVFKVLHQMRQSDRDSLMARMFGDDAMYQLQHYAEIGMRICKNGSQGSKTSDMTRLFLCWATADGRVWNETSLGDLVFDIGLSRVNEEFEPFFKAVELFRTRLADLSDLENDDHELDEDMNLVRGRRKVKESKKGRELRQDAAARRRAEELQTQRNLMTLQHSQQDVDDIKTAVNPGKSDEEEFIYIDPSIASRIKEHQIEGVRFMWREVTVSGDSAQGCLLAHTMGLGKTMQAITIMVTIARAAASPTLCQQLPEALRDPKFLVLCPPGLIENWKAELNKWVPKDKPIGITASVESFKASERVQMIEMWHKVKGGVLIMGYEMFRDAISTSSQKQNAKVYSEDELRRLRELLLKGPTLVFADEAHKMKNHDSRVALATKQFKTNRRIALTGSPLANNLLEYYEMINWVAPDFLGERAEFVMRYQRPIEEGLEKNSSRWVQRHSLKKLKLLKKAIKDKINRADIGVLKHTLPPKSEFVLTVSPTTLQREIYAEVVRASQEGNDMITAALFDVIDYLKLTCNHPSTFADKLLGHSTNTATEEEQGNDLVAVQSRLETSLGQRARSFVAQGSKDAAEWSSKMVVLFKILDFSHALGDKVLVFSQSILTLDYVERMMPSLLPSVAYRRIDGSTRMNTRQGLASEFNSGGFDVLLVSTKAGSLGLNMSAANRVVLIDFSFNPSHEEQAVGRAYRIGQEKQVFVYHLVTGGTFEEPLHEMTIFKKQLTSRTIDDKTPNRAGAKMNEYIFPPKDVTPLSTEDEGLYRGKDQVLDRLMDNVGTAATICGITTAETLHLDIDEELTAEEEREVLKMEEDERLRKTDPKEYARRASGQPGSNDPSYQARLDEQQRLINESMLRHKNAHLNAPSVPATTQANIRPKPSAEVDATQSAPAAASAGKQASSAPAAPMDSNSTHASNGNGTDVPPKILPNRAESTPQGTTTKTGTSHATSGPQQAQNQTAQAVTADWQRRQSQYPDQRPLMPSSTPQASHAQSAAMKKSMWNHYLGPYNVSLPVVQRLMREMPGLVPSDLVSVERVLKFDAAARQSYEHLLFRLKAGPARQWNAHPAYGQTAPMS